MEAKSEGIKLKTYSDFRKMIDEEKPEVIINATPEHWHTLIKMYAAKSGVDIYFEKPLTLIIDEGKRMVKAVRDTERVLQTGTQQRSSDRFRMACEMVRNGRIGKLKEVNVWLLAGVRGGPFKSQQIPETLN